MVLSQRLIRRQGVNPANFLENLFSVPTLFPQQLFESALVFTLFEGKPESSPHCLNLKAHLITFQQNSAHFEIQPESEDTQSSLYVMDLSALIPRTWAPQTFGCNLSFEADRKRQIKRVA